MVHNKLHPNTSRLNTQWYILYEVIQGFELHLFNKLINLILAHSVHLLLICSQCFTHDQGEFTWDTLPSGCLTCSLMTSCCHCVGPSCVMEAHGLILQQRTFISRSRSLSSSWISEWNRRLCGRIYRFLRVFSRFHHFLHNILSNND